MAAKKKAPADDAILAVANIAISGQHFDADEEITGVDAEQLEIALRAKRVITGAEYNMRAKALADRDAAARAAARVANAAAAEAQAAAEAEAEAAAAAEAEAAAAAQAEREARAAAAAEAAAVAAAGNAAPLTGEEPEA